MLTTFLPFLALLSDALAQSPTSTSTCREAGPTSWSNCGPVKKLSYLSPAIQYAPVGAWVKAVRGNTATTNSSGSVSVGLTGSGATFDLRGNGTITVNGSAPESFGATKVETTAANVTVKGLPYGWHNFTLSTEGGAEVGSVAPIENGSLWLPATPGASIQIDNRTEGQSSLLTFTGAWGNGYGARTNTSGAVMKITPLKGTALLELIGDYFPKSGTFTPDSPEPFGEFTVHITPAPPYGPAEETIKGSLGASPTPPQSTLIVDATWHEQIYRLELDPRVEYSVEITHVRGLVAFDGVGVYTSSKGPVNITDGAAGGSGGARGCSTAGASGASTSSPGGTGSSGEVATGISALAMLLALGTAVPL